MSDEKKSLESSLLKHLNLLKQKAKTDFNLELDIELSCDLKGTRTIGQCKKLSSNSYLIRLHKPLLEHYQETYIKDVLYHEFAHAVQMSLYKHRVLPHGKEWKDILQTLHDLNYKNIVKPEYKKLILISKKRNYEIFNYTCKCGILHKLTSIRERRIRRGYVYLCKTCKTKLIKYSYSNHN